MSFTEKDGASPLSLALSETESLCLQGRIDRVDVCEREGRVYVKVMDYKSGGRDFSINALYYGLQLQLEVYLNAALELIGKQYPDKEPVPAALLYYRVADPLVEEGETLSLEELEGNRMRSLCATGVVNQDPAVVEALDREFTGRSDVIPVERKRDGSLSARSHVLPTEDFQAISTYALRRALAMGREILDGRIERNPVEGAGQTACDRCPYLGVCGFDAKLGGNQPRKLEKLDEREALARIRKEAAESHGIYG